jgi:hypothetical protein
MQHLWRSIKKRPGLHTVVCQRRAFLKQASLHRQLSS